MNGPSLIALPLPPPPATLVLVVDLFQVQDPDTVSALVAGIDAPVNVLTGPGAPSIAELAAVGVARISVGSKLVLRAYAAAREAAEELFGAGTYGGLAGGLDYAAVNALLARNR